MRQQPEHWIPAPEDFLPRVVTTRELLNHKQHAELLAAPNFRYNVRNPQPPQPNTSVVEPVWPIPDPAKNATSTPRIITLSTPRSPSRADDSSLQGSLTVSRAALQAKPSARLHEMSRPKVTYMVGLAVDKQDSLGNAFRERMRSRILEALDSSYADLSLGPKASSVRQFYRQQDKQAPLEPFPVTEEPSWTDLRDRGGRDMPMPRVPSKEEREEWDVARSQPKKDFTVFQCKPKRKKVPYRKLLPRLEVLSAVPPRMLIKPDFRDPFKVSEGAKRAVPTERIAALAQPRKIVHDGQSAQSAMLGDGVRLISAPHPQRPTPRRPTTTRQAEQRRPMT